MIVFNGRLNTPCYEALSSDLVGGILPGVVNPGLTIYFSDTKTWKIVKDGTGALNDYVLPFGASVDIGDVTLLPGTALIGKVGIDQTTPGTTNLVVADTELPAASALDGTIGKGLSAPVVGAAVLHSDGTNLIQVSQLTPLPVSQTRVACTTVDVSAPAVNTAAVVTYTGDATKKHVITGIAWSYAGGTPVGGNLQITDGGAVVFTVDIDKSGPGGYEFPRPKIGMATNSAMVITLAAGGAGVTGKISIENHWLE